MTNKFLKYCLALIPGALALGVAAPQAQAVIDFKQIELNRLESEVLFAPLEATASGNGAGLTIDNTNPGGTDSSSIVVSDTFNVQDVTVTLNSLTHTWAGDVSATLTNESTSTSVELFSSPGSNDDLLGNFSFNDSFVRDLDAELEASAAFTVGNEFTGGDFAPTNPLSAFNGASASGTWTLAITDSAGGDNGSIDSWDLTLSDMGTASVPFEFSPGLGILLVGAGFGLKLGRDRWRKKQSEIDLS